MEAVGVAEVVGPRLTGRKVGDIVAYACRPVGSYAEEQILPADKVVHVPPSIDPIVKASVMLKGMTAQFLVRRCFKKIQMVESSGADNYDITKDLKRKAKSKDPGWKYGYWPDMRSMLFIPARILHGMMWIEQPVHPTHLRVALQRGFVLIQVINLVISLRTLDVVVVVQLQGGSSRLMDSDSDDEVDEEERIPNDDEDVEDDFGERPPLPLDESTFRGLGGDGDGFILDEFA